MRLENIAVAWLLVHLAVLRATAVREASGAPLPFIGSCLGLGLAAWFVIGASRAGQLAVWPWQLWIFCLSASGAFVVEAWRVVWPSRVWASVAQGLALVALHPLGAIVAVAACLVLWNGTLAAPRTDQSERDFREWFERQSLPLSSPLDPAVQIVKFIDYQCPACRVASQALDGILSARSADLQAGRIHIVLYDFPLENECNLTYRKLGAPDLHPAACEAAAAVRMVKTPQEKTQLRDWLWSNQAGLSRASIAFELASGFGIDFEEHYRDVLKLVEADVEVGERRGVVGTPAVWLNGVRIAAPTAANLEWSIGRELNRSRPVLEGLNRQ